MAKSNSSRSRRSSTRSRRPGTPKRKAWGVMDGKKKEKPSSQNAEPGTRVRSARLGNLVQKSLEAESKKTTYALIDERSLLLRSALRRLPDATDRKIMVMRFFLGQNLKQIAEEIGIEYEEVKERYRVGLRVMDKELRGRI